MTREGGAASAAMANRCCSRAGSSSEFRTRHASCGRMQWSGRGLAISDVQRRRILECAAAARIDGWLDRALSVASVASVDELLG
ncbi:MAG TPA: hypothetical protein VF469_41630 [Kofleriaceae bacterium]